jgi:molybdenum cofactor synthesis domain-containing protein
MRLSRAFSGPGIETTGPKEGKMNLMAAYQGLLAVHVPLLTRVNSQRGITLATRHDNTPVEKGEIVAATRIIPLTIREKVILRVESICQDAGIKLVSVIPFEKKKVGVLVTGNEIYHGRIPDRSPDYLDAKVRRYGSTVVKKIVSPDDQAFIARSLKELREAGADLILVTAGLSVDPDDVTVAGIRKAGAAVRVYGTPVMPGSMFLYAHLDHVPILGLPACVFHHETTVFDLMFPRVLAGRKITRKELIRLGHGGLCLTCGECRYPVCPFGKG